MASKKNKRIYFSRKRSKHCFSAYNKTTKRFFAKCTTKSKSIRQANYIQQWFNKNFL
jgi:hypothetical protein